MRSIKDAALAFARACKASKVEYAFVGGIAVMAWGQPRATMDVDALVRLQGAGLGAFVEACRKERLRVDEADLRVAMETGEHATVFDEESPYHVDVKAARAQPELAELMVAKDLDFEGGTLRVARPEDVIAFKLSFGSPQDRADARSILVRQFGKLDWKALDATCKRLRVVSGLRALLKQAGLQRGQ